MELKEFIRESIAQIAEGFVLAQTDETVLKHGLKVGIVLTQEVLNKQQIAFDIAVVISESNENAAQGGGSIKVLGVGAEGGVTNLEKTGQESISRIKFVIPVQWPSHPD